MTIGKEEICPTAVGSPEQARSPWSLTIGVFPVLVPLLVLRQSVIGLSAHRLGKVTERLWVVQIQLLVTPQTELILAHFTAVIKTMVYVCVRTKVFTSES